MPNYLRMRNLFQSIYFSFILFRLSSVIFVQTAYAPDEYWQSLEVAHEMAFGYGFLTWEWKQGLRSYIHPFIFFLLYKILKFMSLDIPFLLINIPRIVQALFTAASDVYFFLLCKSFNLQEYWIKMAIFTNWFWYYCSPRTIINTFETCLTVVALYYYPWKIFINQTKGNKKGIILWNNMKTNSYKYLSIAAMSCLIRPTSVTIWGPLAMFQVFKLNSKTTLKYLLNCILQVALVTLAISLIIDYICYGKLQIPAYNFIIFNIFKGVSSFYGTNPFHWYLSQGLPVVLGLQYVPCSMGLLFFLSKEITMKKLQFKTVYLIIIVVVALNIVVLSLIPHKEFRFLLPLTPLMMLLSIKFESQFFTSKKRRLRKIFTLCLIAAFIIPSILIGILHQRGPLQLIEHLRNETTTCGGNCSFLFLMPCHSTPLYSYLHVNVSTKFLQCEPPLSEMHFDESEQFFGNPNKWLNDNWDDNNKPTHIAIFDTIQNSIISFLNNKGYKKSNEILHSIFIKKNNGRFILVYKP